MRLASFFSTIQVIRSANGSCGNSLDIRAMPRVMSQLEFLLPTQSGLFDIVQKSTIMVKKSAAEEASAGAESLFPLRLAKAA
jgi:hypothetical protein